MPNQGKSELTLEPQDLRKSRFEMRNTLPISITLRSKLRTEFDNFNPPPIYREGLPLKKLKAWDLKRALIT